MKTLFIDLETIGATDPAIRAMVAESVRPPKTLKKAESIAAWERDERPAAVIEKIALTALDGAYGQIICAGYAFDDAPVQVLVGPEAEILTALFSAIEDATSITRYDHARTRIKVVGHNVAGFDLPFLRKRAVIHGIKPPRALQECMRAKPWDVDLVGDTLLMWDADRERRISLDKLCTVLGIPSPKGDLDGSQVGAAYEAGQIERIAEYCRGDVEATRKVYHRLSWQ